MANKTISLDVINQIADQYNAKVNSDLYNNFSTINKINAKYKLTEGTEKDFNNAATFFLYSNIKNSKLIDTNENTLSRFFGNMLQKYYNSELSNEDIKQLLTKVRDYNNAVKERYFIENATDDENKKEICRNIMNDFFKIDPDTLEFSENGYGTKLVKELTKNIIESDLTSFKLKEYQLCVYFSILNKFGITTPFDDDNLKTEDDIIDLNAVGFNLYVTNSSDINISTYPVGVTTVSVNKSEKINSYGLGYRFSNPLSDKDIFLFVGSFKDQLILDTTFSKEDAQDTKCLTEVTSGVNGSDELGIYKIDIAKIYKTYYDKCVYVCIDSSSKNVSIEDEKPTDTKYIYLDLIGQSYDENLLYYNELLNFNNIIKLYREFYNYQYRLNLADSSTNIKKSASSVETYYLENKYNFNLISLVFNTNRDKELLKVLEELGLSNGTELDYTADYKISIQIIYKEFNKIIRQIDLSEYQNMLIAEYYYITNSNITTFTLDQLTSLYTGKTTFVDLDNYELFKNNNTNDALIRSAAEAEIVSYLSGNIISFGATNEEKEDIKTILKLYSETRAYFFKVLLNKAMTLDNTYAVFEKIYIVAYTIERFMSSRLDNLKDINKFTDEDCSNFLKSYGLETLNEKINNDFFSNATAYKKRIISKYNELMAAKGSRQVLDIIFDIFNYDTSNLDIYQYNLVKINSIPNDSGIAEMSLDDEIVTPKVQEETESDPIILNSQDLKFVEIPYNTRNKQYEFNSSKPKMKSYNDFIENDVYWSEDDVNEENAKTVIYSPQSTKYLGIKLQKNIFDEFIKYKYTNSAINFLNYVEFKDKENNFKSINKLLTMSYTFDSGNTETVGIYSLYLEAYILFNYYNYLMIYGAEVNDSNVTDESFFRKYGINLSADLSNLTSCPIFEHVPELFKTRTIKKTSNGKDEFTDYAVWYYVKTDTLTPGCVAKAYELDLSPDDFKLDNVSHEYIPISYNGSEDITTDEYKIFKRNLTESNVLQKADSDFKYYTNISVFDEALRSISIINFINSPDYYFEDSTESDNDFYPLYTSIIKSFYCFNKKTTDSTELDDSEISLSNNNYYDNLLNYIIDFPISYMQGKYTAENGYSFTKEQLDALDTLFTEFFTYSDNLSINNSINKSDDGKNTILPIGILSCVKSDLETFLNDDFTSDTEKQSILNDLFYTSGLYEYDASSSTNITSDILDNYDDIISTNIPVTIEHVYNTLLKIAGAINTAVEYYDNMKITLNIGSDTNNFFTFIQETVKYFISYTSSLYKADLTYSYDTKKESIPYAYSISDVLINDAEEYLYYDEEIAIDSYDTNGGK